MKFGLVDGDKCLEISWLSNCRELRYIFLLEMITVLFSVEINIW